MSMLAKLPPLLPACLLAACLGGIHGTSSAQSFTLYTPFTEIAVPPGESIDYSIDVINKGSTVKTASIAVSGLPKGWNYQLKSGGWSVSQVSVLPGERKNVSLQVQVPLRVNKGTYHFQVAAPGLSRLPLTVKVSQEGTFKTEFTTDQANMVDAANSTFTFNAKLRNSTADNQVYGLRALTPPGWTVAFKSNYKQVSSVNIEANRTQDITIEVDPPDEIAAGTYKIPVAASTGATSAELVLETGITGSYGVQLNTPSGLMSTAVTAGDEKRIPLIVKNSGSAELKNVGLQFNAPVNWDVVFDPKNVDHLAPGQTAEVFAIIKPDRKAIAGDYMANLMAKTAETSATVPLRVSVETSLLWSWSGILIILLSLGSVYYLFRKFGRR